LKNRKVTVCLYIVLIIGLILYSHFYGLPFHFPQSQIFTSSAVKGIDTVDGYGVSASNPIAVEVGMEILENGGNAVDAAIAVAYTLGVVDPFDAGIGGGGAMIIYPVDGRNPVAYEYRECAPLSGVMTTGMVGIPGFVKGMEEIHHEFGTKDLKYLLEPAIKLAEDGFKVSEFFTRRLEQAKYRLPVDSLPHFFPGGRPLSAGERLTQTELAETLKQIQINGADYFYRGILAEKIAARISGIEVKDFENYEVKRYKPVSGVFDDYKVYSAPPPLGGVTLIQMLQLLEITNTEKITSTGELIQALAGIVEIAYRDRLTNITDPDFSDIPVSKLTSLDYAKELTQKMSFGYPYEDDDDPTYADDDIDDEGDTLHFVIVDKDGMMVSSTNTLSQSFGSAIYLEGFFLNNQLRNFAKSSQSPNSLEPGKRPRSFLSPTILAKEGKPVIGIGTPGGNKIPMILMQILFNFIKKEIPLQEAIELPRLYYYGNILFYEDELSYELKNELREHGYGIYISESPFLRGITALVVDYDNNQLYGGAEYRVGATWKVERATKEHAKKN